MPLCEPVINSFFLVICIDSRDVSPYSVITKTYTNNRQAQIHKYIQQKTQNYTGKLDT